MSAVRTLIIALLMLFAVFFLATGLDIPIPHLPWRGLAVRDIPIGIVLLFAGIAVARFWTIPQDEERLLEEWKKTRNQRKP